MEVGDYVKIKERHISILQMLEDNEAIALSLKRVKGYAKVLDIRADSFLNTNVCLLTPLLSKLSFRLRTEAFYLVSKNKLPKWISKLKPLIEQMDKTKDRKEKLELRHKILRLL